MKRRTVFTLIAAGAVALAGGVSLLASWPSRAEVAEVTVYKDPYCGCCNKWVEHLKAAGFAVTAHDAEDMSRIKTEAGVPAALESCHTAKVGGYVIEGHVPADDIKRLLAERPDAVGLAVPGMPIGSPGMEQGDTREPYDVILFRKDGTTTVFASH
jgi:hypothetical protein